MLVSCNNSTDGTDDPAALIPLARTERNLSYGTNSQQTYDLYLPENRSEATTKTVIIVHGGGWTSGDKADVDGLVGLIQRALPSYAVINMNYRLANGTNLKAFPNQIDDIERLINMLVANKTDYGINGTFTLYGVSAGAHISALYAYTQNENNRVKAVINMVGPVDFTDPFYFNNAAYRATLTSFIDTNAYPSSLDAPVDLSPVKQVTTQSPPTINFYGSTDPLVPISQLARLDAALQANNVIHNSTTYNGGHGNWDATQYADLQAKIKVFIQAHY